MVRLCLNQARDLIFALTTFDFWYFKSQLSTDIYLKIFLVVQIKDSLSLPPWNSCVLCVCVCVCCSLWYAHVISCKLNKWRIVGSIKRTLRFLVLVLDILQLLKPPSSSKAQGKMITKRLQRVVCLNGIRELGFILLSFQLYSRMFTLLLFVAG